MMLARWSGRRSGISFWISLSDIPFAEPLARAKILNTKLRTLDLSQKFAKLQSNSCQYFKKN